MLLYLLPRSLVADGFIVGHAVIGPIELVNLLVGTGKLRNDTNKLICSYTSLSPIVTGIKILY
jgi:hypothetical protein